MYTEGFEQWFKMNKNMTTPINEWNKACTDMCRRMAQQNLDLVGENFSRWSDQFKRLSNTRKPEDLLNLQRDCINENMNAAMENIQKIMQISMENAEQFTKLCGSFRDQSTKSSEKERSAK